MLPFAPVQADSTTTIGGQEIYIDGDLWIESGFFPAGPTDEVVDGGQQVYGSRQNDGQLNGRIAIRCNFGDVMVGFRMQAFRQGNGDYDLYKFFIKCK